MLRFTAAATLLIFTLTTISQAQIVPIDLLPEDVGSSENSFFSTFPTEDPTLYFGTNFSNVQAVDFDTAPDGSLNEGGSVTTQYSSIGVTMNDIRISAIIFGGNNYGEGFAAEDDFPQVYTFSQPVIAVGIINTSPDNDQVDFYSGPDGTGTLLLSFDDASTNFNIDRFVGGIVTGGTDSIRSFVVSNESGNLELDELIFAFASDQGMPGDINCDGLVNLLDVAPFIDLLSDDGYSIKADINLDGVVNLLDIGPFVTLLSG